MTSQVGFNQVDPANVEATMAAKPKASSSLSVSKIIYKVANVALKVIVTLGLALTLGLPLISKTVRNFSEDLFFGVQERPTTYKPEKEAKRKAQFLAKHETSFETARLDRMNDQLEAEIAGNKPKIDATALRRHAYEVAGNKGGAEAKVLDQAARVANEANDQVEAYPYAIGGGLLALGAASLASFAILSSGRK